jgi:hypothetical protein
MRDARSSSPRALPRRISRGLSAGIVAVVLALCLGAPAASAAVPDLLLQSPEDGIGGGGAGQMSAPWSVAADPNLPGDVYVADKNNHRIDEFTPWGEFVRAWGWGVEDGSNEFQVCIPATDCEQGIAGGGAGQLKNPEGITVDSESNVYVLEGENHRVQKFDSEGEFILTFGLDVNKTKVEGGGTEAERNLCTAASGDVCQAGKAGGGPGQFELGFASYTNVLTASPVTGTVFLGEGTKRIQAFNPDGSFKEEIKGGCLEGKFVHALTTDTAGNLYVSFLGGAEVRKLKPSGPTAECLPEPKFAANDVFALAVGPEGHLFADLKIGGGEPPRILEFDVSGGCLNCGDDGEEGKPGFDRSPEEALRGLAVGSACGPTDVYINHAVGVGGAFFRAFGQPPNSELCPQPKRPPEIKSQYTLSAETTEATVQAEINPRFWPDTRYYVEYGTDLCSAGGCTSQQPLAPGSLITAKTTQAALKSAAVVLEGLSPATTYHYRFVAESEGGGPVFGTGSEPSFAEGAEASFTTFAKPGAEACPANEAFRTGASALLPDCRAYELVSPLEKASGDVIALPELTTNLPSTLDQSSLDGEKLSYGSYRSFAGESAPFTTQYIAERGAGGWRSRSISPPRERITLFPSHHIDTELKALSPDLCESWWRTLAEPEPPLDPVAVSHYPNLYRRADGECGAQSWEALTTVAPPNLRSPEYSPLELQGHSADGTATIYVANDSLPGSGATPQLAECSYAETKLPNCHAKLYYRKAGEAIPHYVCILPGGSAHAGGCSAGTYGNDQGKGRMSNLQGAISADGSRVFWTAAAFNPAPIYLRENPAEPQSALAQGAASGTGTLTAGSATVTSLIAAQGKATFTVGSPTATLTETTIGKFVAGQPLTALGKVPSGTTILSVEGSTLTLSNNATGAGSGNVSSKGPLPFQVGQEVSGKGIAPDTTIEAVALGELTLSKPATASGSNVALTAGSPCTEAAKACTIAVSQEAEGLSGTSASRFWAAAADGSRALFTSGGDNLTSVGGDLYSFEVDTRTTTPIAKKVLGVMGTSTDAKRVYLVSEEDCGGAGQLGKRNLYLYEEGDECAAGEMAFVAELAEVDVDAKPSLVGSTLALEPYLRTTRVSVDGLQAAFVSSGQPTGYDNTDRHGGKPAAEVYRYDASANGGAGELVCASCNPSGARPLGRDLIPNEVDEFWAAGQIPTWQNNLYASRALSEDGNRLFFESSDALTPRDTNGLVDVYQWEAPGTGGCSEGAPSYAPSNGGCVNLISSGQAARPARFNDASPDGSNVFFSTLESLVGLDYGLIDIYVARVVGGFPEPPPPAPECEAENCQHPRAAPEYTTPSSLLSDGPGNLAAPASRNRCAKGKVRRGKRCLKRQGAKAKANRQRRAERQKETGR